MSSTTLSAWTIKIKCLVYQSRLMKVCCSQILSHLVSLISLFHLSVQVTSGMVISTFLSAPIMYVSAWLLTIPLMDPTPLVTELENVSFNISIVSLIALVCVFVYVTWSYGAVSQRDSVKLTRMNTEGLDLCLVNKKQNISKMNMNITVTAAFSDFVRTEMWF